MGEIIGHGSYSLVYRGLDLKTNQTVAIKKMQSMPYENGVPTTAIREVSLLKEMEHDNIINNQKLNRLLDVISNIDDGCCIIFEHLDLDLRKFMATYPQDSKDPRIIKNFLHQILSGIKYCHEHRILHRDLKPSNLLVDLNSCILKIADFGLANTFHLPSGGYSPEVVTLWYRPPEMLLGSPPYSTSVDNLVDFVPNLEPDGVDLLYEKYLVLERIGKGAYGTVYRAFDCVISKTVAMKAVPFRNNIVGIPSSVIRETSLLKDMEHENIVRLLDVQHHQNKICVVLEYLEFNLAEFMRKFPSTAKDPQIIKYILLQILHGVAYCHSQKIIHRDLKPQNLLIDRNKILKIADFGLSRAVDVPLKIYTKKVATLHYMAPEILFGAGQYSAPVDIWAVGCIFGEMVTHRHMFNGCSETNLLVNIFRLLGTPNEETWPGVTSLFPFISKIVQSPPQDLAEEVRGLEPAGVDLLSGKCSVWMPGKESQLGMLSSMLTLEMYRIHLDFLMAIPFFFSAVAWTERDCMDHCPSCQDMADEIFSDVASIYVSAFSEAVQTDEMDDKYLVLELIGRGSNGTFYKAFDCVTSKTVAMEVTLFRNNIVD
ncbi:unnamed protein product [Camellia sinensis]